MRKKKSGPVAFTTEAKEHVKKSKVAVKFDDGKARYDLIPGDALEALAQIYTYGCIKYDDNNWRKGFKWGRVFGALMRHSWAFWRGEDIDPESGMHHMAHAMWQCATLYNFSVNRIGEDDRVIEKNWVVHRKRTIRRYNDPSGTKKDRTRRR